MPVQNSKGSFPTGEVLRRTHALTERKKALRDVNNMLHLFMIILMGQTGDFMNSLIVERYVRRITSQRVQTRVTTLEIETHLRCRTSVVTRLTLTEVLKNKRKVEVREEQQQLNQQNNERAIYIKTMHILFIFLTLSKKKVF